MRIRHVPALGWLAAVIIGGAAACGSSTGPSEVDIEMQASRVALSASGTCLLQPNGQVACRGGGFYPAPIVSNSGSSPFVAVTGGLSHYCALAADSTAHCWGSDSHGQLGNSLGPGGSPSATPVVGGHKFVQIEGGIHFICALTAAGEAWCWGRNDYGALGIGATGSNAHEPVAVSTNLRFRHLSAHYGMCALTFAGKAYCWGGLPFVLGLHEEPGNCRDQFYQLFIGTDCLVPTPVAGSLQFRSLAGDSCGLTASGQSWCWGNAHVGNGSFMTYSVAPVRTESSQVFMALSAGAGFTCALDSTGKAWCWGGDNGGQLGQGTTELTFHLFPVAVITSVRFVSLTSSFSHSCGETASGELWCWGINDGGQIAPPGQSYVTTPVRVFLPPQ